MKKPSAQWSRFFKENLVMLVVVCVATWLRVWQLDSHGILFSDAGRDLLVAHQAVEDNTFPLLGIPSSVPRFKQGPVSIWIEMVMISLFGVNTLVQSLTFALIAVVAVIGVYEFVCIYISKKHAVLAAWMMAVSPLAIAHARVPYHTTPLPLALILYLFSLLALWHKKKHASFWAGLGFAFLFQFELAMAPLFLLLPFTWWQRKYPVTKNLLLQCLAGVVLGLLPQVIFDVTHRFSQIGLFFLWIGHKLYEFASFQGGGTVQFSQYFSSLALFGGRVFSTDYWPVSVVVLLLIILGFYFSIVAYRNKQLKPATLLVELSLLLLMAGYFVHGAPSEAYFPPFLVLLPIHLAVSIFYLPTRARYFAVACCFVLGCFNAISVVQHNFFVSTQHQFAYGASTRELRQVLEFIQTKSPEGYNLATFNNSEQRFPSWFDNYRWLALEYGYLAPDPAKKTFYIEPQQTTTSTGPFMFRDFETLKVLWRP